VNTANRPFDVTISVNASNQLTLTVVDNPTSTPVNYPLVTGQTLALGGQRKSGRVHLGHERWNAARFRIQNPSLSGGGLSGISTR
jgi:hypothetical protein